MPDERTSLIAAESAQPALFSDDDMARLMNEPPVDDEVRECTAAHLFRDRPHIYKLITYLTAEGLGQLRIREITGCHTNTIAAVQDREGGTVEMVKERISKLARSGAQICIESIIEKLNDPAERKRISARDMAIIHGVLVDKSELLSGGATARVQHIGEAAPMDYTDYVAALPAADVIDVAEAASTSMQGETVRQKGAGALAAGSGGSGPDGADQGGVEPVQPGRGEDGD